MEFDCESLRRLLGKYKFRDLTVEELKNVNILFPHFRYSMDTYVFKDSSQKDLLNFTGTIPVMYQDVRKQNFWVTFCFVCILQPKSVIVGLIKEMIAKFQEEFPVYSLSSSDEARQVDLLAYIARITEGVSDIDTKSWANHENRTVNKITVVGGGELGIACTLAISAKGIADKLVLLDLSEGTKGGSMDLDIFNLPNVEISKDLSASAHSKVVIFTVNSLGSSQSYLDVVQSNVDMFRALVPVLGHYSQQSVLLVASQPVEIMTYVTWKLSAFPVNQVIGIGCNLDSQRLQYVITKVLKAQTSGKEVWVIGEQGEDKVPTWSGQEGMSPNSQVQLSNRKSTLTSFILSSQAATLIAKGYYGINSEVFLSLPCILGTNGVSEVIKTTVKEDTVTEKLQNSASSIHGLQQQLKL
ncbi:ubiquitin-conjugating enzyme E2 variant 3 [Otolemur garnettii]|uniref:ubiquitin-conjugating enzyme E2 variant 3 n=1 Tax=Otolemur garnettii TaxID=30611 RepID=UPI000C7EE6AD|nr:ubiquitin-conjugating enzyme E2 variant 3 [Otolemur garnettii]